MSDLQLYLLIAPIVVVIWAAGFAWFALKRTKTGIPTKRSPNSSNAPSGRIAAAE